MFYFSGKPQQTASGAGVQAVRDVNTISCGLTLTALELVALPKQGVQQVDANVLAIKPAILREAQSATTIKEQLESLEDSLVDISASSTCLTTLVPTALDRLLQSLRQTVEVCKQNS